MNDEGRMLNVLAPSSFILQPSSFVSQSVLRRSLHANRRIVLQRLQLPPPLRPGESRIRADGDDHRIFFLVFAHLADLIEVRTVEHFAKRDEGAFVAEARERGGGVE